MLRRALARLGFLIPMRAQRQVRVLKASPSPKAFTLRNRLSRAIQRRTKALRLPEAQPSGAKTGASATAYASHGSASAAPAGISRKWGPSLEYRTADGGIIALSFISVPGRPASFSLRDAFGNMHKAVPIECKVEQLRDVNLLMTDAPHNAWIVAANGEGVRSGKNFSREWSIAGEDTYYIASIGGEISSDCIATATAIDPLTDGETPIKPHTRYRFRVLAAAHRCQASVKLDFKTESGETIPGPMREVSQTFEGGTAAADYVCLYLEFETPANAALLSIQFDKNGTVEGEENSLLFFARPSLREAHWSGAGEAIVLPASMLQHARNGGSIELTQVLLEAPSELLDGKSGRAAIHAQFGTDQIIIPDVIMENGRTIEIHELRAGKQQCFLRRTIQAQAARQREARCLYRRRAERDTGLRRHR